MRAVPVAERILSGLVQSVLARVASVDLSFCTSVALESRVRHRLVSCIAVTAYRHLRAIAFDDQCTANQLLVIGKYRAKLYRLRAFQALAIPRVTRQDFVCIED